MYLLIILSNVSDSSARGCTRVTYVGMCKFMIQKEKKSLFIPIKLHLITISSVIPYTLEINSTSSSLKKKKRGKEDVRKKERKREGKEREEERV